MQYHRVIQTELGLFNSGKAFYIDKVIVDYEASTLLLKGELIGAYCQPSRPEQWLEYELYFKDVSGFKFLNLDLLEKPEKEGFQEICESNWLASRPGSDTDSEEMKHFLLVTNDEWVEIMCQDFVFSWRVQ